MIRNIQALRAYAALLVVFVHLRPLLATVGAVPFGSAGVDLFFVISGFIMVHTTRMRPPGGGRFMRNRFARVAPLYWLLTVAVFLLSLAAPGLLQSDVGGPGELLKSLAFLPYMKANHLVQPVLFLGWTLNYEMFFYVLFGIGLCFRRYHVGLLFCAACLLALALVRPLLSPMGVLPAFYTSPVMLEFAAGMGLALVTDAAPRQVAPGVRALTTLGLLAALALPLGPLVLPSAPQTLLSGIEATVLVGSAVLLERWGWSLRNAAVLAVGDASYALYLTHPFVTQIVQKLTGRLNPGPFLGGIMLAGCLLLVVAVAVATHRVLEKPLSRWARRGLRVEPMPERPA